jgi:superfamily II DNA or RNA helicase
VSYDNDGNAIPDFVYSYSAAIADRVCRPVFFPAYEGSLEWLSGDETYLKSFSDDLDEAQESHRLRAALQSDDWCIKQLTDAQQRLSEIRTSHPEAGGLIVAMNQVHARYLADLMQRVSYSKPVVVLSDDQDADDRLKAFRSGVEPWIIAVRKVSEGVDVPRLRVCVYMTNVITEMFFRQVVGRVVRYTPGVQQQESFVYIPADRRLIDMAMRIQEERLDAALNMDDSDDDGDDEGNKSLLRELSGESDFRVLDGSGWHESTITYNGYAFTCQEIESAKPIAAKYGVRPEIMAQMVRDGIVKGVNGHSHEQEPDDAPLYERKRKIKKKGGKLDRLKSEVRHRFLGQLIDDQRAYQYIGAALNRAIGKRSKEKMTEVQYQRVIELLEEATKTKEIPSWLR